MKIKKFSPCKVNLMLAITGVREDGFHDLISLVTPTKFGDDLETELLPDGATSDTLSCDLEGVPCDESNLVIKAAKLFRQATGLEKYFKFDLEKRTPAGAGLGGGSSNGAIALASMNELCGKPLSMRQLEKIAAELGSDCPPESRISEWLENPNITGIPLINNMQVEAFKKYPALEIILEEVREKFRVPAIMSGSGSACFAIVNDLDEAKTQELEKFIKKNLGESCFIARG